MSIKPYVTVCVPVYNGGPFIAETLSSIERQSYRELTVLVSDDFSDDESVAICRQYTRDSRFRLSIRSRRRGWIENCNWLLDNASDDFVCIVAHDDVLDPYYIEALVDHLLAEPDCILAFSDIQVFGLLDAVYERDSIRGGLLQRVLTFIARHHDGQAFRGLIKRRALDIAGGLRRNEMDNFAADVAWLGRLAQAGELHRVPQTLYRKRYHSDSVSMQWNTWNNETKAKAWSVHCRELLRDALGLELMIEEKSLIFHAALQRLLAIEPELPFRFIHDLSGSSRIAMVVSLLGEPSTNWNEFTVLLKVSEADRAQRLENINTLAKALEASEADRAQRLENINTLAKALEASEADRAQRLENINTLAKALEASEADRAQRLENINTLTKALEASEADRAQRLENINTLTKALEASEADRAQRLENINTLTKALEASEAALKESEADRAARLEQINILTDSPRNRERTVPAA